MYSKRVPFKDFKDKPRNQDVYFNLTEREVFKLMSEFQMVFAWRDSIKSDELQDLDTEQVVEFYNAFETILLAAWGVPSEDGLHFRKAGRYEFEESALFNAAMVMFVTEPEETMKLIEGIMPKDMEDMVRKADENLDKLGKEGGTDENLRAEIDRLRAQLGSAPALPASPTGDAAPQQ